MRFKLKILYFYVKLKVSKWIYRHNYVLLQQKRWKQQMKRLEASPFYKQLLKEKTTIQELPILNKTVFMQNFNSINTCGIDVNEALQVAMQAENSRNFSPQIDGITVGLSTGTSGNRGCFLVSENERALWVACILDRVIGFSLRKRKVAFFMRANSNLYQSVQSQLLSFHFFDILQDNSENITSLDKLKPDIIVGQPSLLFLIAKEIEGKKLNIAPQKIISIAEVLASEDKIYLEKVFAQTIHQVYQCTEGLLATTCKYGVLHFNEDFLVIEKKFINTEQTKFHPIITDLFRISQPIIRYELNDIITLQNKCKCGSTMLAINQIEGRQDDVLVFHTIKKEEILIFPDAIRKAIVMADETISDYAVIQNSEQKVSLFIQSENNNSFNKAETALQSLFFQRGLLSITIHKLNNDPHTIGHKKRRVKNESRKRN
ncbi:MAG: adenylate synthase [Bacteroidia bacterium]|nr:adenylate synthase [Bacteroidia bacterium]MCO5254446.1 adenylate synthase [Bacteroidota bacterium]